jgi:hypothetical protein
MWVDAASLLCAYEHEEKQVCHAQNELLLTQHGHDALFLMM